VGIAMLNSKGVSGKPHGTDISVDAITAHCLFRVII
jgi:hypothetical protein